jgi:hypothetical protein
MGRFEVQIMTRKIEAVLENADAAYRWLDEHAHHGERYQLNAISPDGMVVVIESGNYIQRRH